MNFPSSDFDDAVAASCHGTDTVNQGAELAATLQTNAAARDEYLWQVELHSHLATRINGRIESHPQIVAGDQNQASPRRGRRRNRAAWLIGAIVVLVMVGATIFVLQHQQRPQPQIAAAPRQPAKAMDGTNPGAEGEVPPTNAAGSAMGIYKTNVVFASATNAPIIVGSGRLTPIELGAQIPYSEYGTTLHLWDWSKSTKSRVLKDTRLWLHERFAISPDGKWFVWASGVILDLNTGERTKIDLGGEYYFDNAGGNLERIQNLQFTPDGRRLAVLVSNIVVKNSSHPLRKQDFSTVNSVQVIEFPSGKLVCEFPASFPIAFSDNNERVIYATPEAKLDQQVIERSAVTGEVLREYKPRVKGFAYALCYAPDAKRVAVYDGAGEVLVWNTTDGSLAYRVDVRQAVPSSAALRYSPDGKHLAIAVFEKLFIVNAATGTVETTDPTKSVNQVHWSPDGTELHLLIYITTRGISEGQDAAGHRTVTNMYPEVQRVDLRGRFPK